MSIHVTCSCGARITLRDRAAGTVLACPRCGRESSVPEPEERIPCPFCAEPILPEARLCPQCRTRLDHGAVVTCTNCGAVTAAGMPQCRRCGVELGRPSAVAVRPPTAAPDQDRLRAADWIFGLLFPCIGVVLGIVHLCTGQPSRGGKTLAISFVSLAIWAVLASM